jgi:hypothetical protein
MNHTRRPTENQIFDWQGLSTSARRLAPRQAPSLPRLARVLWLSYIAGPPLNRTAIGAEYGLSLVRASALMRRGLSLLASLEEQGQLPEEWDPESPLGRAVAR